MFLFLGKGSNYGLHHVGPNAEERLNRYRTVYSNCTYVEYNLEIVFLEEASDYDLSFLESIEEVQGYVLIVSVMASRVPLTNLRIIRGLNFVPHDNVDYSMFIAHNYRQGSQDVGLHELQMPSLTGRGTGNKCLCVSVRVFRSH